MFFVETSKDQLENTLAKIRSGKPTQDDYAFWESEFIVKTITRQLSLSTPSYAESLGIYFQPRGKGPVITLYEVAEIFRVLL